MGTKAGARKKSKAMKIVLVAIRAFSKAKDFYMVSLQQFGNGVAGNPNPQASSLAMSYSVSSAPNKASNNRAGLRRSMSESSSMPKYGVGSYVRNDNHNKGLGYGYDDEVKRSYSVGEKKMERIDEDESGCFRETDAAAHHLYPRSKTYSVTKKY